MVDFLELEEWGLAQRATTAAVESPQIGSDDLETDVVVGAANYNYTKWKILTVKNSSSPTEGRDYCRKLYEGVRKGRFGGCKRRTDLFFFEMLGTSDVSSYFYGHVDRDLGSVFECWYKRTFQRTNTVFKKPKVFLLTSKFTTVVKTILYCLG